MELKYKNPILQFDFSDPDVIRVNDDFYMVASSFNNVPGVPILHSKNLVEWEIINYVFDRLPMKRFDHVCLGDGAWAPSIRYHDGYYYCIIPFPDEGIYVSRTKNPYDKWSELWCLIEGKGIIDPCPIWDNDRCYLAVGFAKSRIGFNSEIGVYEVSCDLKRMITDYKIVYDGHENNPTIEGPKFYKRNNYYYILCPAGSVKGGWQVALRSKNIYGPYESKVILMQNGTKINGPHQGALIDLDDTLNNYSFIHFQDMWAYGRIIHLQPVKWENDWPLCGQVNDPLIAGSPVLSSDYPVSIKTDLKIDLCDDFKDNKLSLLWQTPANRKDYFYNFKNGLCLNCINEGDLPLYLLPQTLLQKVPALQFSVYTKIDLSNMKKDGEVGFVFMGKDYTYLSFKNNTINLYKGSFNQSEELLYSQKYDSDHINIKVKATNSNIYQLNYVYYINGKKLNYVFEATAGRWIGATYGLFARGKNEGYGCVKYFKTVRRDD